MALIKNGCAGPHGSLVCVVCWVTGVCELLKPIRAPFPFDSASRDSHAASTSATSRADKSAGFQCSQDDLSDSFPSAATNRANVSCPYQSASKFRQLNPCRVGADA